MPLWYYIKVKVECRSSADCVLVQSSSQMPSLLHRSRESRRGPIVERMQKWHLERQVQQCSAEKDLPALRRRPTAKMRTKKGLAAVVQHGHQIGSNAETI